MNKEDIVKQEILTAAKRVFQKWGLNKSTVEDIAREAGKGKSTLYYYYKSKDEIFEALAFEELNNMVNKAKNSIETVKAPKEKLKKYISTILNEIKQTVSIYPLIKGELKGNKDIIVTITRKLNEKEEAIILEILKQGTKSGEFNFLNEYELDKAATVMVGIIRGLELYLFLDNDDVEKMDIATRLITEGI
jgi:AcrR family transcriptional regulator